MPDVDRLMRELPHSALMEWMAFYQIEIDEAKKAHEKAALESRAKGNRGKYR